MNKQLIEKYKNELLKMYSSAPKYKSAEVLNNAESTSPKQGFYTEGEPYSGNDATEENGRLTVSVTSISELYPVKGAKVTVFTGDYQNPKEIAVSITNESGKTTDFILPAPPRELSLESNNTIPPYSLYNILVESDNYADNIHLNIPIFRGVTSMQRSNLIPLGTTAQNKGPFIYNEFSDYNLKG